MRPCILLACILLGGCIRDSSITFTHSADPLMVTDGTAYDRAELDLTSLARIAVPKTATVFRSEDARHCRVIMEKTLDFAGHPDKAVSIEETRAKMGCATRTSNDTIEIGTFGEYDTHIEGGAFLHLRISVPVGMEVICRDDLEGPYSISNMALFPEQFPKQQGNSASSAARWRILPVVPLTRVERRKSRMGRWLLRRPSEPRRPARLFQAHRRQTLEAVVAQINFDAGRSQCGCSQDRLGVIRAENDRCPHKFAHEFDLGHANIEHNLAAVGQLIRPFPYWLNANLAKAIAGNEAVDRAGIDEK